MRMRLVDRLYNAEEEENIVEYNIGRGGYYGMTAENALHFLGLPLIHSHALPKKVGFSLEDKGGGINVPRPFPEKDMLAHGVPKSVVRRLKQFEKACRARYIELNENSDDFIQ